jgi:hypothetical protein
MTPRPRIWPGIWFLLVAGAIALVLGSPIGHKGASRPGSAQLIGPRQTVFNWSRDACEPLDVPDTAPRAFRDAQGQVVMLASHYVSRRLIGPSLNQLTHPCSVVMHSDLDPNPGGYDDHEWIAATYTPDGERVFALIHNEYQGNTHRGRCPTDTYLDCWYNSITSAISTDGGRSFAHIRPPPQHLVASVPYRYFPGTGPYGLFQPSNIIYKQDDGYYYALIRAERYRSQSVGSCLIRTKDLADPKSWRAWDGSKFAVSFIDPYLYSRPASGEHFCEPVSPAQIGGMTMSLTWNTYFRKYMLASAASKYDVLRRKDVWGIYFSLSDDLIHWSQTSLIMPTVVPWTYRCGGPDTILGSAVLDPASPSRNFNTAGREPYLYFILTHFSHCQPTLDRDLLRVRIRFSK